MLLNRTITPLGQKGENGGADNSVSFFFYRLFLPAETPSPN
jgi:hypothetical protein